MRILWLCNMVPGRIREHMTGKNGGGLWVDHVLSDLEQMQQHQLMVLCPGSQIQQGSVKGGLDYETFVEKKPHVFSSALERQFQAVLERFCPEIIHIWGTEYGHTLAMTNAARTLGMADRVVISIQGLCGVYAGHYCEGLPNRVVYGGSFRDLLRLDNVAMQRRKFEIRGQLEMEALKKTAHVLGRTPWDEACTARIQPDRQYHFCNETLREPFYEGQWQYERCVPHRIFASNCSYPVKGFHYLLEAFAQVKRIYPDATLTVPGRGFLPQNWKGKMMQEGYRNYLAELTRRYHLEDSITFLGSCSAEEMKQAYLDANVFVLPSTIENSPNSLGEAMLLGVPCVAADVGGVSTMMKEGEGFVYQGTASYMLAHYIQKVFEMGKQAEEMGCKASAHARMTHDPMKNLDALLNAYDQIVKGYQNGKE